MPNEVIAWSVRPDGLYVRVDGVERVVIPPAQFPAVILTLVRELKNAAVGKS
jgi:hypothetical protein